jgi:hypothetical protein
MKVIAFNGSPRKAWNTATLLLARLMDEVADDEQLSVQEAKHFYGSLKQERDSLQPDCPPEGHLSTFPIEQSHNLKSRIWT